MKELQLSQAALGVMDSRPMLDVDIMAPYSNRKTRRVFASLARRKHLEKLPERMFPMQFIVYFILNYPEVCDGGRHSSTH